MRSPDRGRRPRLVRLCDVFAGDSRRLRRPAEDYNTYEAVDLRESVLRRLPREQRPLARANFSDVVGRLRDLD